MEEATKSYCGKSICPVAGERDLVEMNGNSKYLVRIDKMYVILFVKNRETFEILSRVNRVNALIRKGI